MQIKILNDFINAYDNAYNKKFKYNFEGKIEFIKSKLNEPFMHLGENLKKQINLINLNENINIAIIGQFSSGKSTLLNLILKKQCLPTGIVPVTFKPTYLKYANDYFLMVEFEDGTISVDDIDKLVKYTDQRNDIINVKSLHIYAPVDILKDITFIDTPGLNANDLDTINTFKELKKAHFLIWLSLIDNAGKQSEKDVLEKLIYKKSLCLLNQKDKLNEEEIKNVLNYANEVFCKYFDNIIAISCKEAKNEQTYEKSNYEQFLNYLKNLDKDALKKEFIINKFDEIFDILQNQYNLFLSIYDELKNYINNFRSLLKENEKLIFEQTNILNNQFLKDMKFLSEKISKNIFSNIKEKEYCFYKNNVLLKNTYKKYTYKAPFLDINFNLNKKDIAIIRSKTMSNFENIKNILNDFYKDFEKNIIDFKNKFSNIEKNDDLESEIDFAKLRVFSSLSDELFLKEIKEELFKTNLELDLLFEKLSLKTFLNYESAVKTSILYFNNKINESRQFYELDNTQFYLYYPKIEEINENILNELSFYEFEALLLQRSQINKIISNFLNNVFKLLENKKELIKTKQEKFTNRSSLILSLKNTLN